MLFNRIINQANDHGPSELNRINFLDGWRGLAIIFVLTSHFFHIDGVTIGAFGVNIFFVLSGMLMSNILFVKKTNLSTFYKRRISRVFPVFIIYIVTWNLASFVFNLSNEHHNFLSTLLFLRSYIPEVPSLWNTGIPIGHLWSLNAEEHCYILLSLLTLIAFTKGKEWVLLILLGCCPIILQFYYFKHPEIAPPNYEIRTEIIASHLLLSSGYFLIKHKIDPFIHSWIPIFTFLLAILFYTPYTPHWSAKWVLSPFLLAFTVNHLNLLPNIVIRFLNWNLLRLIGIWSFSIYLWQHPFYYYGIKHNENSDLYLPWLLLAASIITGIISFYWIENPIRRYLNNKW